MPEISIIVPTHNRRKILSRTLAGVFAQEDVEFELIVVDDGSTDDTGELLNRIEDSRLRVVRHPASRGLARARNTGVEHANGRWVAFLDDDDLWAPRKLREQLDAATASGANIVFSGAVIVNAALKPTELHNPPPAATIHREILRRMAIPGGGSNLIAETNLVRRVGGFDEQLSTGEDWEYWIRLIRAGKAVDCRRVHVAYVVHESNMTIVSSDQAFLDAFKLIDDRYRSVRREEGISIDGVTFTRWLAGTLRRRGNRRRAFRVYMLGALRFHSPGNVVRAIGTMFGERALRAASRRRSRADAPAWLDLYRPGGSLESIATPPTVAAD